MSRWPRRKQTWDVEGQCERIWTRIALDTPVFRAVTKLIIPTMYVRTYWRFPVLPCRAQYISVLYTVVINWRYERTDPADGRSSITYILHTTNSISTVRSSGINMTGTIAIYVPNIYFAGARARRRHQRPINAPSTSHHRAINCRRYHPAPCDRCPALSPTSPRRLCSPPSIASTTMPIQPVAAHPSHPRQLRFLYCSMVMYHGIITLYTIVRVL
ncbi:hypothetical protein BDW22DRAFT_371438 [Trametopsis cervina]|nr:hypothetical protein BDW22DRAFT_371438 [Trametopsis cervina]